MRSKIENWLLEHWYGTGTPPWYLRLLVPIYRTAYQHSQRRGQSDAYHPALPLIIVGNITAGGTGKTPLVVRLCEIAMEMSLKPGIASTGYGRQDRDTRVVAADSDPRLCGDEPILLAHRTGVPVMVAAKRREAVERLGQLDLDLIISDDGLQQADLERDIEFCVVDGQRGTGNGFLIPAGPLREGPERLGQVDHVVTNGQWSEKPDALDVSIMELRPGTVHSVSGDAAMPVDQFQQENTGARLHAVAGIGNPKRFFDMLAELGFDIEPYAFADHHEYRKEDFDSLAADSTIIMTEKDAVKCRSLGLQNCWYIPVDAHLPGELEARFKERLAQLVKNRS